MHATSIHWFCVVFHRDHYHKSYDSQERWRPTALKSVQQMSISLLGRTPMSLRLDDDDHYDEDRDDHDGYDNVFFRVKSFSK